MNNNRLNKYSKEYLSDMKDKIESRCFFLFAGTNLNSSTAFVIDI